MNSKTVVSDSHEAPDDKDCQQDGLVRPVIYVPPASTLATSSRAVGIVMRRELIRFRADKIRIVTTLLQPMLYIFVIGTGLTSLTSNGSLVNLRTFIYPGALGMSVMFTAVFSAGSIVWDREFGFMREMLVAPISRTSIVVGKGLGGTVVASFQAIIVLSVAGMAGVPYSPALMIELLGEAALLAFTLTSFGILASVRVKTMQGFMGLTQMLIMPLFFTAGAMFPLSRLPAWLTVVTRVNPLAYAIDPIRRAVFSYLALPQRVREMYAPGITWDGWKVPTIGELLIVLLIGIALLGVAISQFRNIE